MQKVEAIKSEEQGLQGKGVRLKLGLRRLN